MLPTPEIVQYSYCIVYGSIAKRSEIEIETTMWNENNGWGTVGGEKIEVDGEIIGEKWGKEDAGWGNSANLDRWWVE
jgi:hypothetical protein